MGALTVSMIVKDEERYLKDCLSSVKGIADEIVIVDTGSTDKTIEIAKEFDAKIFHFEWVNDFSAARNYALANSKGDWILYLDADERLDPESIPELKQRITEEKNFGCLCTVFNKDSEHGRDNSMRYVRLFKNSEKIRFTGNVHEQIIPSLVENDYELVDTDVNIIHIGYDIDIEKKKEKAKRNLILLMKDYDSSQSPYYAFQIAQTYNIIGDYEEAEKYFRIAINSNNLDSKLRCNAITSLSQILFSQHKVREAEELISYGLGTCKDDPYTFLLASKISFRLSNMHQADDYCKKAIFLNKKHKINKNKSLLAVLVDEEELIYYGISIAVNTDKEKNLKYYLRELSAMYNSRGNEKAAEISLAIVRILAGSTLTETQISAILKNITKNNIPVFMQMLGGYKQIEIRLQLLAQIDKNFGNKPEVKKALAKTYDELGRLDEAISVLEGEISNTDDPSALLYTISFYLKKGDSQKVLMLIENAETHFKHIPEVLDRLNPLKTRILAYIKQSP